MPTFQYNKLVRDNIPDFHQKNGHIVKGRTISGDELLSALCRKLHEEADGVEAALSREEPIEEVGDVQQIINDLCALQDISSEELKAAMQAKAARKGGFQKGEYIEVVTIADESDKWVAYCRNHPDKYPEIEEKPTAV